MSSRSFALLTLLPRFLIAGNVESENWPQWRGPAANGVSKERDLPSRWGPDSGILWKAPLAGLGTSTPIVYGERVFLTYQVGGEDSLHSDRPPSRRHRR